MIFNFCGVDKELLTGIEELCPQLGIELGEGGMTVDALQIGEGISVQKDGDKILVRYGRRNEFFRFWI